MRRKSVLLVTLLLLLAGVGGPATAGTTRANAGTNPLVVSVNDTANYLAIPDDDVSRQTTTDSGLSLGTAIAADTSSIQGDVVRNGFDRKFERAANESAKTAVLRSLVDQVDRRTERLQRRDRATIRAYANGSMTATGFVRARARIHEDASHLQSTIEHAARTAREDDTYTLSTELETRLDNLPGELEALQGSVSADAASMASGAQDPDGVYVEASNSGYTLAYVTGGLYFRETYLGDERKPNVTDQFTMRDDPRWIAAQRRGYELYPWIENNSVSSPTTFGFGTSGIYRFSSDGLTAYIDGGTTNVFRESQQLKLVTLPVSNTVTDSNNSTRIRVNETYETGPAEVTLTNDETGAPINGTVTVDGTLVGRTGEDGSLWIIEPSGPNQIEATTERGENVSVFLSS